MPIKYTYLSKLVLQTRLSMRAESATMAISGDVDVARRTIGVARDLAPADGIDIRTLKLPHTGMFNIF